MLKRISSLSTFHWYCWSNGRHFLMLILFVEDKNVNMSDTDESTISLELITFEPIQIALRNLMIF